jgi:murein DD-endopeptidase MepM/ murein hydrolase activator NlpD
VDWNRRTKTGGWLDDTGDPVLAAADGTVAEVDPREGLVMLTHWGGLYRTEYRHMTGPFPKVGDKVTRGDRIGSIGNVAGDGRSFGAHLHHVHWRRDRLGAPWRRVKQSFYGKPLEVSVSDSDTRPSSWNPPAPVMVQGPPPKATWEESAKEALKALEKAEDKVAALTVQVGGLNDQVKTLKGERDKALADLAACEALPTPDCTEQLRAQRESLLDAVSGGVDALLSGLRSEA